jgi:hypothetical protein
MSTMNNNTNDSNHGLREQLLVLQSEVAQLRAAESSLARRLVRLARVTACGTAAALAVGVLGSWIGTAWSAPAMPKACNGAHSGSLYCFDAGQPARAAEVNSNFEALALSADAVAADLAAYKVQPKPGVTALAFNDTFIQNNQSVEISGYTSSNSLCFVGRIDVFAVNSKCQANLVGTQWTAYSEGSVFCTVRCLRWSINP